MITVQLYITTDDPKTVGKTLTPVTSVQGDFNDAEDVDILNPDIVLGMATLPTFNYVGIDNRFYFVSSGIKRRIDGTWLIPLKEDVLETWKTEIKNLNALIERQEHVFNLNIKDPLLKVTNKTKTTYLKYNTGMTHESFVLATV